MAADDSSYGVERAPPLRHIWTESDAYTLKGGIKKQSYKLICSGTTYAFARASTR